MQILLKSVIELLLYLIFKIFTITLFKIAYKYVFLALFIPLVASCIQILYFLYSKSTLLGGWILYHWATWKAHMYIGNIIITKSTYVLEAYAILYLDQGIADPSYHWYDALTTKTPFIS